MNQQSIGLEFKETMAGGFALNVKEPLQGLKQGESENQSLAIHVKVIIDDIDEFIEDRDHTGYLSGTIDFPPFGNDLNATGIFNCYKPADDPDTRYMDYNLSFKHQGDDYYLAGRKIVRDDSGMDLWKDTTTLLTTLHKGVDKNGDILGAGVLSLGIVQLGRLMTTISATGTTNLNERNKTIIKFGRFFMGNLWDSYGGKFQFSSNSQQSTSSDNTMDFDVVVIGSGFGGAVSACRLAEKGLSVCVLERGRRWNRKEYPRGPNDAWWWSHEDPEKNNGFIDIRWYDDMAVAQGCGVGGGSLIYANVFIESKPFLFEDGWPPEITYKSLKPYYDLTGEMLNVQTIPDNQLTQRYKLMKTAADAAGYGERHYKVPLAVSFSDKWHYGLEDPFNDKHSKSYVNAQGQQQGTCVHCGNCDLGCQVGAKNTLDLNYLPLAEKHGAQIRPLHLVRKISPIDNGYRVDFEAIDADEENLIPGHINARKVIVAAGTMGTNELMLKCRDEFGSLPNLSNQLGVGWSANGDFLTPAYYEGREISPSRGPTISSAIDFLDGSFEGQRFFVEDGGFPDLLGNVISDISIGNKFGLLVAGLQQAANDRNPLSCIMPWFGQAVDAADGHLHLSRSWLPPFKKEMKLDWNIEASEAAINALKHMHEKLSAATDGKPMVSPSWSLMKDLITPHPLGGCRMGTNIENGVVDHKGEVFGYPGLFVADGSIIPKAIGLNPSRTIAALAERIAALMKF